MAAYLNIVCAVVALGLCTVSEARTLLTDQEYDNLMTQPHNPQQLYNEDVEQYLLNLRDLLEQNAADENSEDSYDVTGERLPSKRLDPNQFFGSRGRRAEDMDMADEDAKQKLVNMVRYFQYLHSKRTPGLIGNVLKRQPPQGFHAVRGRRSASIHHPSLP